MHNRRQLRRGLGSVSLSLASAVSAFALAGCMASPNMHDPFTYGASPVGGHQPVVHQGYQQPAGDSTTTINRADMQHTATAEDDGVVTLGDQPARF